MPSNVSGNPVESRGSTKPAADGNGVILRCFNDAERPTAGRWRLSQPIRDAQRVRADEGPGTSVPLADGGREIRFEAGGPAILGYDAKWETTSAAYMRTPRVFPARETPLFDELERLALAGWRLFALTGYARVDFRVAPDNRPIILEINANPCLAADAGFCAAAEQMGLTQKDVVAAILAASR